MTCWGWGWGTPRGESGREEEVKADRSLRVVESRSEDRRLEVRSRRVELVLVVLVEFRPEEFLDRLVRTEELMVLPIDGSYCDSL